MFEITFVSAFTAPIEKYDSKHTNRKLKTKFYGKLFIESMLFFCIQESEF